MMERCFADAEAEPAGLGAGLAGVRAVPALDFSPAMAIRSFESIQVLNISRPNGGLFGTKVHNGRQFSSNRAESVLNNRVTANEYKTEINAGQLEIYTGKEAIKLGRW